jgi:tetratricopeptide (TPR) repeat protein
MDTLTQNQEHLRNRFLAFVEADPVDIEQEKQLLAEIRQQGRILANMGQRELFSQMARDINLRLFELTSEYYPTELAPLEVIPLQKLPRAEYFINREQELANLLKNLQPGHIETLCGPGGIGKTALAAEAVWRLALGDDPPERFPDGIICHSFYQQSEAIHALEQIARAYGEDPFPDATTAARRALFGRTALIILDGAEDADNLPLVLSVIQQCGVLITTRRRQDAATERQDIAPLPMEEALSLLQAWAKEMIDDEDAAREICKLVGGLPLAVCLAGRYLATNKTPATEYLEWLKSSFLEALDHGQRRLESVPVLLERSLAQVSKPAQQVLAVASMLSLAPFTLDVISEAIQLPIAKLRRLLSQLVSFSLVLHADNLYEISHALIHTYVRRQLDVPEGALDRIAAYYIRLARNQSRLGKAGHIVLDLERPHYVKVLEYCQVRGAWNIVEQLALAIDDYLDLQVHTAERIKVNEAGLAAARALKSPQNQAAWLGNLGNVYSEQGQYKLAIDYYNRSLKIAREINDQRNERGYLANLGLIYNALGQTEQAIKHLQKALMVSHEIGDRSSEGTDLGNLGNVHRDLGQVEQAITYFEQALAIANEVDDRNNQGAWLANLGNAYRDLGQVRQAINYYEQALAIKSEVGDQRNVGVLLGNLGNAYRDLGQVETAIDYYKQALATAHKIGDQYSEGLWLGNLGNAYRDLGQVRQAITQFERALANAREFSDRYREGAWLANLGNAYRDLGQMEKAIEYCQQALAIAKDTGDRFREGALLGNLGLAYNALGQVEQAIDYHQQALAIAREVGDRRGEGSRLGNLGMVYISLGQTEQAVEYYEQAVSIAREIGDRHSEGNFLGGLGNAHSILGHVEQAIDYYQQGLAIAREIGDRSGEALHSWNIGLLLEDRDPTQAAILMSILVDYERQIGHPNAQAHAERVRDLQKRLDEKG